MPKPGCTKKKSHTAPESSPGRRCCLSPPPAAQAAGFAPQSLGLRAELLTLNGVAKWQSQEFKMTMWREGGRGGGGEGRGGEGREGGRGGEREGGGERGREGGRQGGEGGREGRKEGKNLAHAQISRFAHARPTPCFGQTGLHGVCVLAISHQNSLQEPKFGKHVLVAS